MKLFFSFLILFTVPLFGQNPDGKNASLHVTPSWLRGTSDYQRVTSVWYPPSLANDAQSVATTEWGTVDHPFAFGVSAMMKIPATSYLTLSLSYSFNQRFEEYGATNLKPPYFSQFWSMNGALHSMSVTMSLYNLFSVYQE
ncbi:MAG: hypothetical protein ACYC09_03850 [Bacteroidota bacterium]